MSFSQGRIRTPPTRLSLCRACSRSEKKVKPGCKAKESRPTRRSHKVWGEVRPLSATKIMRDLTEGHGFSCIKCWISHDYHDFADIAKKK